MGDKPGPWGTLGLLWLVGLLQPDCKQQQHQKQRQQQQRNQQQRQQQQQDQQQQRWDVEWHK